MKLKTILGITAALFLFSLLSAPSSFAEKDGKRQKYERNEMGSKKKAFLKNLKLSDEQKKQIKKIRTSQKEKMKAKRIKVKEARQSLRKAMQENAANAKLRTLFAKVQKNKSEMAKSGFETMLKIRAILTPEQRKKFNIKKMQNGFKKRRRHKD
jgi:Spy/CpxP family protein refolding chaperone